MVPNSRAVLLLSGLYLNRTLIMDPHCKSVKGHAYMHAILKYTHMHTHAGAHTHTHTHTHTHASMHTPMQDNRRSSKMALSWM